MLNLKKPTSLPLSFLNNADRGGGGGGANKAACRKTDRGESGQREDPVAGTVLNIKAT